MTAKAYLSQLYQIEIRIKVKSQQITELKVIASGFKGIDYSADKVQSSPSDRMAEMVGRWSDMESELSYMLDRYIRLKNIIIEQILAIGDERYIAILYGRYVEHKTLREISAEMAHDYKYICRLHGKALTAFDKVRNGEAIKEDDKSRL